MSDETDEWWVPPKEFYEKFFDAFFNYSASNPTMMPDARDYIYKKAPKEWVDYWKSGGWEEPKDVK